MVELSERGYYTIYPKADAGPDLTVEAGRIHTFDASGSTSATEISSYNWTFRHDDRNEELDGVDPEFLFQVPGVYVVKLTVEDAFGYSDTDTVNITVEDTTSPMAAIEWRYREDSERRIFDGRRSTDLVGIVNWTWEIVFENEITNFYGETAELHRVDPGRYQVTLTVRDAAGNEDSEYIEFTIEGDDDGGLALTWIAVIAVLVVLVAVVAVYVIKTMRPPEGQG